MNSFNLIIISLIIPLLIFVTLFTDVHNIYNCKYYGYIYLIKFCIILSIFILVVFSIIYRHDIYIACFSHVCKRYKFKDEVIIASYVNVSSIIIYIPVLWKILIQFKSFFKKYKLYTYIIILLDSSLILLIFHIYFGSTFFYLTHGHVHYIFPYVLISAMLSLMPACLSVYMYIVNNIYFSKVIKLYKIKLIDICLSSLIDSLSMLGISLAFNSLVYSTRWFVSVGLIYWGSYIFILISLTTIVLKTIRSIKYKIIYPNNECINSNNNNIIKKLNSLLNELDKLLKV